jgi:PST family polysaccharide transporter
MTMARLLIPAEYGLYAMVDAVLRWAALMAQMGLSTVLVQRQHLSDAQLRAVRTLALALSAFATVVVAAGAPLAAAWFGTHEIVPLLRVASLSFLASGIGLTSLAMLRRRMQFGRLGAAELAGYVLGNGATSIYLASRGAGVWSVVIGTLVGQSVQSLVAILQAKLPLGFSLQFATLRTFFRDGAHVSVNTFLDITNNTMDTIVIARVMPPSIVGLFNRSAMLATLPAIFLWTAVSRVAFPSYARLQHTPREFSQLLRRVQGWSSTICVAVPLGMIPAADVIVHFLLGADWAGAVPIVRLLLLGVAFDSLAFPYHNALDALGCYMERTKIRLIIFALRATALGAFATFRTDWLFAVASIAAACTWIISVRPVARKLHEPATPFFLADLKVLSRALLCFFVVGAARYGGYLLQIEPLVLLASCVICGAATLALVLRPYWPARRLRS